MGFLQDQNPVVAPAPSGGKGLALTRAGKIPPQLLPTLLSLGIQAGVTFVTTDATTGQATVAFPTVYENTIDAVIAIPQGIAGQQYTFDLVTYNGSGFTVELRDNAGLVTSLDVNVSWIAVGS